MFGSRNQAKDHGLRTVQRTAYPTENLSRGERYTDLQQSMRALAPDPGLQSRELHAVCEAAVCLRETFKTK